MAYVWRLFLSRKGKVTCLQMLTHLKPSYVKVQNLNAI